MARINFHNLVVIGILGVSLACNQQKVSKAPERKAAAADACKMYEKATEVLTSGAAPSAQAAVEGEEGSFLSVTPPPSSAASLQLAEIKPDYIDYGHAYTALVLEFENDIRADLVLWRACETANPSNCFPQNPEQWEEAVVGYFRVPPMPNLAGKSVNFMLKPCLNEANAIEAQEKKQGGNLHLAESGVAVHGSYYCAAKPTLRPFKIPDNKNKQFAGEIEKALQEVYVMETQEYKKIALGMKAEAQKAVAVVGPSFSLTGETAGDPFQETFGLIKNMADVDATNTTSYLQSVGKYYRDKIEVNNYAEEFSLELKQQSIRKTGSSLALANTNCNESGDGNAAPSGISSNTDSAIGNLDTSSVFDTGDTSVDTSGSSDIAGENKIDPQVDSGETGGNNDAGNGGSGDGNAGESSDNQTTVSEEEDSKKKSGFSTGRIIAYSVGAIGLGIAAIQIYKKAKGPIVDYYQRARNTDFKSLRNNLDSTLTELKSANNGDDVRTKVDDYNTKAEKFIEGTSEYKTMAPSQRDALKKSIQIDSNTLLGPDGKILDKKNFDVELDKYSASLLDDKKIKAKSNKSKGSFGVMIFGIFAGVAGIMMGNSMGLALINNLHQAVLQANDKMQVFGDKIISIQDRIEAKNNFIVKKANELEETYYDDRK